MLWDAAQAQVVRGQVQEGKVAALSSPLWTTDSCGHSALTLFNPPLLCECSTMASFDRCSAEFVKVIQRRRGGPVCV